MGLYIFGRNAVLSKIESGTEIEQIFLQDGFRDQRIVNQIGDIPFKEVSIRELEKLVGRVAHQGIVALVKTYEYTPLEKILATTKDKVNPLLVVLDGIEDPHNMGAIIRTCDAIGVDGVIVPKHGGAPLTSTVYKVSTGAVEFVPIAQVTNLTRTLQGLKKIGYWVVGAEASNAQDYREVDYKMPTVLVVGSEGKGISRLVLEQCDFKVKLPMVGHVTSLNVSVATAILLYQIYANRNKI